MNQVSLFNRVKGGLPELTESGLIVMTTIIRKTLQHGVGIHAVVSIPSICLSSYSHCVEETDLVQLALDGSIRHSEPKFQRRHM